MKLLVNDVPYRCTGKPRLRDPVQFKLPESMPEPEKLGERLVLQSDNGAVLREIAVADYARWYISGSYLIGTNTPEPEPTEPIEPVEPIPTAQEDVDAMFIDHEYRLTLLELGVSE